jgi:hypothetical protein
MEEEEEEEGVDDEDVKARRDGRGCIVRARL